jgi:glycosyltransferase family protein
MLKKIEKEFARFKKRLFHSSKAHKQLEKIQYELENMPYELYDKFTNGHLSIEIPEIKNVDETVEQIITKKSSLARFGDGEFILMDGGRIDYQHRSEKMALHLKEVIASDLSNLLIALPPCFGFMDNFMPPVLDFWRKCMHRKREQVYSWLEMDRVYYDAFFSRVYMHYNKTDELYAKCESYYKKVKKIWTGRDIVICEGQGTRFGMFNDLLDGAESISRILCPPRNAFDKYDEILSAFDNIDKQKLIIIALGPTATVLSYDLCKRGYQAIDTGSLDVDYEWFLRKEVELGVPLEYKYVDSDKKGRAIQPLDDPEYKSQIIKTIQ